MGKGEKIKFEVEPPVIEGLNHAVNFSTAGSVYILYGEGSETSYLK